MELPELTPDHLNINAWKYQVKDLVEFHYGSRKFYVEVSDGRYDMDEDYTNKNSLIFQVFYFRKDNLTCFGVDLCHVIKTIGGHELIIASAVNWKPSKHNCTVYSFVPDK